MKDKILLKPAVVISVIVAILLALTSCLPVFAIEGNSGFVRSIILNPITFSVDSAIAYSDSEVLIPVYVTDNPGVSMVRIEVTLGKGLSWDYDSKNYTDNQETWPFISSSDVLDLSLVRPRGDNLTESYVSLQFHKNGENSMGNGILVTLKLAVDKNAGVGQIPVSLNVATCANETGARIPYDLIQPGFVTVLSSIYEISLSPSSNQTFDAQTYGYNPVGTRSITVVNTGNRPTGDLTLSLSGANPNSFSLSSTTISSLDPYDGDNSGGGSIVPIGISGGGGSIAPPGGGSSGGGGGGGGGSIALPIRDRDSFTVKPNNGLSAGTYTATINVIGGNGISGSVNVSFTVNKANQTLTAANITKVVGTGSINLNGHAASTAGVQSGDITYIVTNAGGTGARITGTTLSYNSGGTATITATAVGGNNYNSAATTFTLTVTSSATIGSSVGGGGGGGAVGAVFTVKFDSNGGSSVPTISVSEGFRASKPLTPTKDGFIFAGWYTNMALTNEYNFNVNVTGNITLYAKWTQDENVSDTAQTSETGSEQSSDETLTDTRAPGSPAEQAAASMGWSPPTRIDNPPEMADITQDHWAAEYINTLAAFGIVDGYPLPDGTFEYKPDYEITRAELFKLVAVSLGLPLEEGYDGSKFADWDTVAEWARPYVGAVVNAGLVYGALEENSLFINANNNISRQEAILIAVRALKIDVPADGVLLQNITDFDDADGWAKDALAFALNNEMINVDGDKCRPTENAKRDEIAMLLCKMMGF